jgi:hypothetical protein
MLAARLDSSSDLEASHSPMLSMPEALARVIVEFESRHRVPAAGVGR